MAKKPGRSASSGVSRREFAKRVTLAAGAIVPSARVLGEENEVQDEPSLDKLSPESRARFESMWQSVQGKHGDRLVGEQKTRMRKIIANNLRLLESVYAVPVKNGDSPATALLLAEDKTRPRTTAPSSRRPIRAQRTRPNSGRVRE